MQRSIWTGVLMMALGNIATAEDMAPAGPVLVENAVARATAATAQTGAGYFTLTNTGTEPVVLMGVAADFPRVMLHNSVMQDGVARMEHLDEIAIPAGEAVTFAPGGKHVMFMGLGGDPFEVGETIPAVLMFKHADPLEIVFEVVDDPEAALSGHDH